MGISTKTGDRGITSLLYGGRVQKDSLLIETIGILDELSSFLGLGKSLLKDRRQKKLIETIQTGLWLIGSEIATKPPYIGRLSKRLKREDVKYLDSTIKKLEKKYKPKEYCFLLTGENTVSAILDVARTIARRAERRVTTLLKRRMLKNRHILVYLNRLSDLLYLLARSCEKRQRKIKSK